MIQDQTPRRLCILGESPLVEEYASLCLKKGFTVQVRLNAESTAGHLPPGAKKIRKVSKDTDVALELTNTDTQAKKKNLAELDKVLSAQTPIFSSSVTVSATQQAKLIPRPQRLIGIGALPSLLAGRLIEFAPSPFTDRATLNAAKDFAKALGKETAIVKDTVGLVMPRILCMLANEACFALMDHVASRTDIDNAMKLGESHPMGPLEWAEKIGLRQVRAVIEGLHRQVDKQRYRVSPLLQRAAAKNAFPAD